MSKVECEVVLATYNGAKYLPAMLTSLLGQSTGDFLLTVRDDGSTDGTLQILRDYEPKFGGRMRLLRCDEPTGSGMANFSILLANSEAEYVLCADQDDVWMPGKIATTLTLLRSTERGGPAFVFTDTIPVDGNLTQLSKSYWEFKKINPAISQNLNRSLVCPAMLGCASGMNRKLVDLVTPVPSAVTGHDWWALLVAICFGQVGYTAERTMLYRLHGNNQSNQRRVSAIEYMRRSNKFWVVRHGMIARWEQARALLDRFGDTLSTNDRNVISSFISTKDKGFIGRRLNLALGGYLYPDIQRNLAMLIGV